MNFEEYMMTGKQNAKKTITFFMLVTNRDTFLASYSIKSYGKLMGGGGGINNFSWKLIVYCNGLKEKFRQTYMEEWKKIEYVEIVDNTEFIIFDELIPGNILKSKEGGGRRIEGKFEPGAVVWTREFEKFQTDYWVTVDADFEILSPDFIVAAFEQLETDKNLVAVSSDFGDTNSIHDTYGDRNIIAMKRYHTWFCIYKKEAQKCTTSHFFYSEKINYGLLLSFDDAAKFQFDLREQYGYKMKAVDRKYQRQFIHYGAFSKNNSIDTPEKTRLYRIISILSHRGLMGSKNILDKIFRKVFKVIHRLKYRNMIKERERYNYHSKLDE